MPNPTAGPHPTSATRLPQNGWSPATGTTSVGRPHRRAIATVPAPPWHTTALTRGNSHACGTSSTTNTSSTSSPFSPTPSSITTPLHPLHTTTRSPISLTTALTTPNTSAALAKVMLPKPTYTGGCGPFSRNLTKSGGGTKSPSETSSKANPATEMLEAQSDGLGSSSGDQRYVHGTRSRLNCESHHAGEKSSRPMPRRVALITAFMAWRNLEEPTPEDEKKMKEIKTHNKSCTHQLALLTIPPFPTAHPAWLCGTSLEYILGFIPNKCNGTPILAAADVCTKTCIVETTKSATNPPASLPSSSTTSSTPSLFSPGIVPSYPPSTQAPHHRAPISPNSRPISGTSLFSSSRGSSRRAIIRLISHRAPAL
ncbi:hypothetical protein COL940_008961 [Colletotrichum noveboracense]|nr:hypothetical protein COL940_008961 [Colletotrichum noveboracense]